MSLFKKLVSSVLVLCMIFTMLPLTPITAFAAESTAGYKYVLDKDGIDVGAKYLIVSGTVSNAQALRLDTSKIWQASSTDVTVINGEYIDAFDDDSNCLWTFSSPTNGTVSCNGHYLNIEQYTRYQTRPATMQFANFGNGAYGIYMYGGSDTNLQYLYYGRTNTLSYNWQTVYKHGAVGTDPTAYNHVFLYKLVEVDTGFSVTYNGNGNTEGQIPDGVTGLESGTEYTVLAPKSELVKNIGNDTYLFRGWNTAADGSGTEYAVDDKITVTENITLYAEWYLQTKYEVRIITDLDDVHTDLADIVGHEVTLYVSLNEDGTDLIELEKTETGVYTTWVTENGTYYVFARHADGTLEQKFGHKVIIYKQNGVTELLNYSIKYELDGGSWAEGEAVENFNQHANTTVTATDKIPVKEGYIFRGWSDGNGNVIESGGTVTTALVAPIVLTAVWDELIDVTVNITVNHAPESGGLDNDSEKSNVSFQLLQEQNGVNLPFGDVYNLDNTHECYAGTDDVTTYTVKINDVVSGNYNLSTSKHGYTVSITREILESGDNVINVVYIYDPENFSLNFDVKVNTNNIPSSLLPKAVNVKVTYWGYSSVNNESPNWHIITQQAGEEAPSTVMIDQNGNGSGFYSVWKNWSNSDEAYYYRVEVTSFVMPDGTVLPAASSGDHINYTVSGSGLYSAVVTVKDGGKAPEYPDGSNTTLKGSYFDGENQVGIPTVTVDVTPFTVTFDAGVGTLEGQKTVVLENSYKYPDLSAFVPTSGDEHNEFVGWFIDDNIAENKVGSYLTGNVTYVAKYSPHVEVAGTIYVDGTYELNGHIIALNDIDRVKKVMVRLQKNINGVYNDVDKQLIDITYNGNDGTGEYAFSDLPNDGTAYRICIVINNYIILYDNNGDRDVSETEYDAIVGAGNKATVDVHVRVDPIMYNQWCKIDTTRINKSLRPTSAIMKILYRDLGDINPYTVITQHSVPPYGVNVAVGEDGKGTGFESVWNMHTNGTLYEYQLEMYKLFGSVEGVFTADGVEYSSNSPFTVEYGAPNYYSENAETVENSKLVATLVPKEYKIIFDLNLGNSGDYVLGMDEFHIDNGGVEQYAYMHTWSFADNFTAFPYREGYVFDGWTSSDETAVMVTNDGHINVGATVAKEVTLTANWTKLEGTDYTVRFLELNTDKVLNGAMAVTGTAAGASIKAAVNAIAIEGYTYAGALIGGTYYDKEENPALTVSNNPADNLMIIYYLPDGSDGYTEQVESNLNLNKTATLENDGTYTITMETYTKDNPITTYIQQNTPLDIVMVLDQSGSIVQSGYLDDLQSAVNNFISLIAEHGRTNEVDHRIAMVGYAGDEDCDPTSTDTSSYPIAGGNTTNWVNTGVFDSNGDFHPYSVTGFNYTKFEGNPTADGIYYAYSEGEYLLLTHHDEYRHLITEDEARIEALNGTTVYGYINGQFVELTRNTSGLWLYGDKQLYSLKEFFTYHEDVWTHRKELEYRQIHAYGTGANYSCTDGHGDLYIRDDTTDANPDLNVYHDALVPVSVGAYGSGGVNPGLTKSSSHLGSNGGTYVQYGIEMANRVFEANPTDPSEGRVRIMVMFTDGLPGTGTFDATVANEAIAQAYTAKNTHGAYSYTIGLYKSDGVDATSDIAFYMNAVSTNYPDAKTMNDVKSGGGYTVAADGSTLNSGGPYYVQSGGNYYELSYTRRWVSSGWWGSWKYGWSFTANGNTTYISDSSAPTVSSGKVGGYTIYKKTSIGYKPTENSGYYATTDSEQDLKDYFAHVMREITTKITTEIILHNDTILRDIMGQGLVLTDGTVITAYTQQGTYNPDNETITWATDSNGQPILNEMASLEIGSGATSVTGKDGVSIYAYNLDAQNATNPDGEDYHPHAVDITGYNFDQWYISDTHPTGYKMVVKVTRIEARDDVEWGKSTNTNYEQSGLWLPADENGNRQLLLPFNQPTTIFVERAYVLDYAKPFTLSGWYFDSEDGKQAEAIHLDCNISDGMNWFDKTNPNTENSVDNGYGNTSYGNLQIKDGKVKYTPVTSQWNGADKFYIFGNTWRKTVLAQDANQNGNLWNKVMIIPANNVYYEDSFITGISDGANAFSGFTFDENWQTVYAGDNPDSNTETPEHQENSPYGDVHGWTDSLDDDKQYSDGSAHVTGTNKEKGAKAEFTFTGTGIDVYTRTNDKSGIVVAVLTRLIEQKDDNGNIIGVLEEPAGSKAVDNLSLSDDYYQIPTVSFEKLLYGTYKLTLIATSATNSVKSERFEYYIDGVRVYKPLGNVHNSTSQKSKEAYGKELNATFTLVRDVLLDYGDFNSGLTDDDVGQSGAIFVDWVQDGQNSGNDGIGTGIPTYELGTFEKYGPKNEVYLSQGQSVVLKVDPSNTYYMGLKSLTGEKVTAAISGIDFNSKTEIEIEHTTDMYYEVFPQDGYIVIQNASPDGSILSLTKLRTTNMHKTSATNGIQSITPAEAVEATTLFSLSLGTELAPPVYPEKPDSTTDNEQSDTLPEIINPADTLKNFTDALFWDVKNWLDV